MNERLDSTHQAAPTLLELEWDGEPFPINRDNTKLIDFVNGDGTYNYIQIRSSNGEWFPFKPDQELWNTLVEAGIPVAQKPHANQLAFRLHASLEDKIEVTRP